VPLETVEVLSTTIAAGLKIDFRVIVGHGEVIDGGKSFVRKSGQWLRAAAHGKTALSHEFCCLYHEREPLVGAILRTLSSQSRKATTFFEIAFAMARSHGGNRIPGYSSDPGATWLYAIFDPERRNHDSGGILLPWATAAASGLAIPYDFSAACPGNRAIRIVRRAHGARFARISGFLVLTIGVRSNPIGAESRVIVETAQQSVPGEKRLLLSEYHLSI